MTSTASSGKWSQAVPQGLSHGSRVQPALSAHMSRASAGAELVGSSGWGLVGEARLLLIVRMPGSTQRSPTGRCPSP